MVADINEGQKPDCENVGRFKWLYFYKKLGNLEDGHIRPECHDIRSTFQFFITTLDIKNDLCL